MANELKPFSVKPLVWWGDDSELSAKCALGHYVISPRSFQVQLLVGYGGMSMTILGRIHLGRGADTPALKAAAQADYERRILSAIETAPAAPSYSKGPEVAYDASLYPGCTPLDIAEALRHAVQPTPAIPGQYGAYTPVTLSGHTTPVNEADLSAGVRDVNERMSRTMHTAQEIFAHEDEPQDEAAQKPRAYMRRWAYDGKDVMDIPEKDRPQDFSYRQEVTLTQLFPDDVPLYSLEPKP